MRGILSITLGVLLLGCGNGGSDRICDPGATQECFCAPGVEGIQECADDGSGWQDCNCGSTDTSTDGDAPDSTDGPEPDGPCGNCDDGDPCTLDTCNLDDLQCDHDELDADGDGYVAIMAPDGVTACGGTDCDDSRDDVYPGAPESCEAGEDLDCSGSQDRDDDEDGHVDTRCSGGDDCDDGNPDAYTGASLGCEAGEDLNCDTIEDRDEDGDTHVAARCFGPDCDDHDDTVWPGATEQCDDVDHDCDGDAFELWDDDHDGYGDDYCGGDDCDDTDAAIYPGAPEELCDTVDNDCNGDALDGPVDDDDDDYIDADDCIPLGGNDCDDADATVYPGATEVCDDVDDDCDGDILDAPDADDDSDGFLDAACPGGTDCDDLSDMTYPGAALVCDGSDHDCSGVVDWDEDGDTFISLPLCPSTGDDCDDADPFIYPGADEICLDGIDQDCDTLVDGLSLPGSVRVNTESNYTSNSSMVWTGSEYGIAWSDGSLYREIYFSKVDAAGSVIGTDIRVSVGSYNSSAPSLTWNGSEYAVAWVDERDGNEEIYFTRLDVDGTEIDDDIRVTVDSNGSTTPSLVWTGSQYAIAWYDSRTSVGIYLTRLSSSGIEIGDDTAVVPDGRYPSMVWNGTWFAVAWTDGSHIYISRIDEAGTPLGSASQLTTATSMKRDTVLVWTGSEYGISWTDNRVPGVWGVMFARASSLGVKIGTDVQLSDDASTRAELPSIAWSGLEFGVAWDDDDFGDDEIMFHRLSAVGEPIGGIERITNAGEDAYTPSLTWSGSDYAISWHLRQTPSGAQLYYIRYSYCD